MIDEKLIFDLIRKTVVEVIDSRFDILESKLTDLCHDIIIEEPFQYRIRECIDMTYDYLQEDGTFKVDTHLAREFVSYDVANEYLHQLKPTKKLRNNFEIVRKY
jgi:hypothetical protein